MIFFFSRLAGEPTGSVSGQPPTLDDDTKKDLLDSSNADATGQTAPGRDGGEKNKEGKEKSAKECVFAIS